VLSKYDVQCTENPLLGVPSFTSSFFDILRSHHESLVEVSIPAYAWKAYDDICTVTLPQLKSLTAVLNADVTVNFETFLVNHPTLEEFEICVINDSIHGMRGFWEAIKRRCTASSAYLKKVHLNISVLLTCTDAKDDWSFLAGMKNLEDFQLQSYFGSGWLGSGERLLACLPRNQKLQRLSLDRMDFAGSFWRYCSEKKGRRRVPLDTKLEYLRGFHNLKRLSFRQCRDAVDNEVMQLIFREMTDLEELKVSDCPRLTDAGISGTGPEKNRVSFKSLKGQPWS